METKILLVIFLVACFAITAAAETTSSHSVSSLSSGDQGVSSSHKMSVDRSRNEATEPNKGRNIDLDNRPLASDNNKMIPKTKPNNTNRSVDVTGKENNLGANTGSVNHMGSELDPKSAVHRQ